MEPHQLERLGAALRTARKAKGLPLKAVAKATGVTPQAVGQWERGENGPAMAKLMAAGAFLEIDVNAILRGTVIARPSEVDPAPDFDNRHMGPADVDVLGITVGGEDGDFWLNGEIVNKVRRPPGIRHAKNVFALNVGGDSMVPAHKPNSLIYVQRAAPAPGDDIVIEMKEANESGDRKSFLKEFVRRAGALIICKQHNPPKELEFKTSEIANIYRVIPLKELMG